MSFLKGLFGRSAPDKLEYVQAMAEMAAESERTYRGMIDTYNLDVEAGFLAGSKVAPSGRGIYKARLYGGLFMVLAYARSGHSEAEVEELLNLATGVALEPLQGEVKPRLDREEAQSIAMDYLISTFKSMSAALRAGPMVPGSVRAEHLALTEHLHEALRESIGDGYTPEVRERFAVMAQGNTAMAMNHASRWIV